MKSVQKSGTNLRSQVVERPSKHKENSQWRETFNKIPYPNKSKKMTSGVKTRKCSLCGKSLHLPILSTNLSSYIQGTDHERQGCREKPYKHGGCGKAFFVTSKTPVKLPHSKILRDEGRIGMFALSTICSLT